MSSGEVWFYHLERRGVEAALPDLLEKTLNRGWRALVRAAGGDLLTRLDEVLWTYRTDAVLPHGLSDDPHAEDQPILLTTGRGNPNGANALFVLGAADAEGFEGFERCIVLFEEADQEARAAARRFWKTVRASGLAAAYWRETERGFVRQA